MAESDWSVASGSLPLGDLARGSVSTLGVPGPNGGGAFVHGFRAVTATAGVTALYVADADYNPTAKGLRLFNAAMTRLNSGSVQNLPLIFGQLQGTDVSNVAYVLGLSETSPSRLVLAKTTLDAGLPEITVDPLNNGVLAVGTQPITDGAWIHVQLGVNVQPNDDVFLSVLQSDNVANTVQSPDFQPVAGMDEVSPGQGIAFIDDGLGINSGSAPLLTGRAGFGFVTRAQGSRGAMDHLELARQL